MITTAFVHIWDQRVGAVAWNPNTGVGAFEYDPEFLKGGLRLSPILMPPETRVFRFPENRQNSTFKGLPGLLADSLPDKYGNALINTWLNRNGRPTDSLNPVETLCFIGKRGMGALEFQPVISPEAQGANPIEISELVGIAAEILSGREEFKAELSGGKEKALIDILKIGTSAGGARPKALIAYNAQTGQVKSGQAEIPKGFAHYLIKFDGVSDEQFGATFGYGNVEMAYYRMALDCGIEMMESHLFEENGRFHFMTQRFDRLPGNEKVHVQTFCAMRHFDFREISLFSYEQLFETMRMLKLPYPEAEQLYRRMAFNVMGRNCDDHTKNFAFRMNVNGIWSLAPAYDVCHAYRPSSAWVSQHCLSINGKRKDILREDLLQVARSMNIKKPATILDQVAGVVASWKRYAQDSGVPKKLADAIGETLLIV